MWNRMHGWLIAIAPRVNHGVGSWPLGGLQLRVRQELNAPYTDTSHKSHRSYKSHPMAEPLIHP